MTQQTKSREKHCLHPTSVILQEGKVCRCCVGRGETKYSAHIHLTALRRSGSPIWSHLDVYTVANSKAQGDGNKIII